MTGAEEMTEPVATKQKPTRRNRFIAMERGVRVTGIAGTAVASV